MDYYNELAAVVAAEAEGDARWLTLRAPRVAAAVRPFQFVLVRVPGGGFTLPRPLSVTAADAAAGELSLLVKPVGKGSAALCALAPGAEVGLVGPLGRAVAPPPDALFVAGGIGVAGVFFAVAEACRRGERPRVLFGARSASQLFAAARLEALGADVTLVTDDGSRGEAGLVSDRLPEAPPAVVACGPRPMYRALRERLGDAVPLFVLMEEHMACGVGACRSCAAPAAGRPGFYFAICQEGPLVDAAAVDWQRMGGI